MHVYIHIPLDFVPYAFLLIERYIWREMHFILSPDFFCNVFQTFLMSSAVDSCHHFNICGR